MGLIVLQEKQAYANFLQNKVFPPPDDHSTHGIEPTIWKPEPQLVESITNNENGLKDALFYIWDFGDRNTFTQPIAYFFVSKQSMYCCGNKKPICKE